LIFLTATFALGPGLIVNEGFKAHMHRPRPVHVRDFGGAASFRPFYRADGDCAKNCSFASGETAAAFWMLAPAALAPPPWRAGAVGMALLFGTATGMLRVAAGGHFLSDVLFSGWLMGLLVIGFWYATRKYAWPLPKAKMALHEDQASL
jgi:membrane-associated phospholipid phosphatase